MQPIWLVFRRGRPWHVSCLSSTRMPYRAGMVQWIRDTGSKPMLKGGFHEVLEHSHVVHRSTCRFGHPSRLSRPVKEFYISIAETAHQFYPGGPKVQAWAFNGQVPGPTLRVTEGDLVRVHFTNKHYTNHTLHFHGLNIPNNLDGVD